MDKNISLFSFAESAKIIEEIHKMKEEALKSEDSYERIYTSEYPVSVARKALMALEENANSSPELIDFVQARVNFLEQNDRNKLISFDYNNFFDIMVQILRGEHIPSDLKKMESIEEEFSRYRSSVEGGSSGGASGFSGSGGGSFASRMSEDMKETYTSYSGSDIVASINIPGRGPVVIGELSELSYSVLREKQAVRSMGMKNVKGFTKGSRFITGNLVFTVFNHAIVYSIMEEYQAAGYPILMDELPLFNIEVVMANEYGKKSRMNIYGVTVVREGFSVSLHDMYIQNAFDFFAIDLDPIEEIAGSLGGASSIDRQPDGTYLLPESITGPSIQVVQDPASGKTSIVRRRNPNLYFTNSGTRRGI